MNTINDEDIKEFNRIKALITANFDVKVVDGDFFANAENMKKSTKKKKVVKNATK